VELGVSALTRRDRLERIAGAERDRRAGRIEMAVAALGEATEWAARVVLALARLPEGEGARTRAILEEGLDGWAAELGLAALDPDGQATQPADPGTPRAAAAPAGEAVDAELAPEIDAAGVEVDPPEVELPLPEAVDAPGSDRTLDLVTPPPVVEALASPIETDELEQAFAEAEAQTDEMHDVNRVAERVLMDEPLGLAELSGDAIGEADAPSPERRVGAREAPVIERDPYDISASELQIGPDPDEALEGRAVDAAWAEAPVWPEPTPERDVPITLVEGAGATAAERVGAVAAEASGDDGVPSRARMLATLERWLGNLENRRGRTG
jgi:hypothetical protein